MRALGLLLCLLLLWLQHRESSAVCPGQGNGTLTPLYFGYMAAVNPNSSYVTAGTIPAVQLALELINNNSSLLSGYTLSYNNTVYDSACSRGKALDQFFDMVNVNLQPRIYFVALLAAGCSVATQPVAELTHYWNFPVMSYAASAPELSRRSQFPSFFRTYPSDVNFVPAFVALVQSFDWRRVCIFTENANLFVQNERPLMDQLAEANITSQSMTFNPETDDISRLVSSAVDGHNETHIFFINAYEGPGRAIICEFYKLGLRYPAYAFITHGWYRDGWWREVTASYNTTCTEREFEIQLDRVLAIQQFPYASDPNAPTISGLSANEFEATYRQRLASTSYNYSVEAYTSFDALWALAIGLDRVQQAVCNNDTLGCGFGPLTALENYEYYNAQVECMLVNALNATRFEGVSGNVEFDVNGTRVQNVFSIFQYQTGRRADGSVENFTRRFLGELDMSNGVLSYINTSESEAWPLGIPPDGTVIEQTNTIHVSLLVIFYTVVILGLVFAVICLIFNIVFRNKKIIKLTSPNLNYVVAIGCIVEYVAVIFLLLPGLDVYSLALRCGLGYWLVILGYTLGFSAILAKMWRVYYIFHNPTPKKRTLKDWHLMCLVGILNGFILFILAIGEAIPQARHEPTLVSDKETPTIRNELNVTVTYWTYNCYNSSEGVAYQAVVMAYLFILQVIGIVLAFQTRKVKVKILNDAKQVTAIIYITSVCVVIIIMTTFAFGGFLNVSRALLSLSITIAATAFLLLSFVPKMYSLYKDPEGKAIFSKSGATSLPPVGGGDSSSRERKESLGVNMALAMLGDDPKATIATLQAQVEELQDELRNRDTAPLEKRTSQTGIIPAFFKKSSAISSPRRESDTSLRDMTPVVTNQSIENGFSNGIGVIQEVTENSTNISAEGNASVENDDLPTKL